MKKFTEVKVCIVYYANGNVLMLSNPSGSDPWADDCYDDLE